MTASPPNPGYLSRLFRLYLHIYCRSQKGFKLSENCSAIWRQSDRDNSCGTKNNEGNSQATEHRPVCSHLTKNGQNTEFVNRAKYLGVRDYMQKPYRFRIQNITAVSFLLKSEWIWTDSISTIHEALVMHAMTYSSPACEFALKTCLLKLQLRTKQGSPHTWQLSQAHTGVRVLQSLSNKHVFITTPQN